MSGDARGGKPCTRHHFSAKLQLLTFRWSSLPPGLIISRSVDVQVSFVGVCGYELCVARSQQHPTSSLSPAMLCDVRAASIAKHSGFQLAALVCVGEERVRGWMWSVFPCGYAIWLLRPGMCSAWLSWFVLVEASEASWAAQGCWGWWALLRAQEQGLAPLLPHPRISPCRIPAQPETPPHFCFLRCFPCPFPSYGL